MKNLLIAFLILAGIAVSAAEPFFSDAKTVWSVRLLQPDQPAVKNAGKEFKRAMKVISGADFADATADAKTSLILIGVSPELEKTPDLISIKTKDGNLYLTGGSPRSALYAIYEFLRRELGVRWLWPGADGEFMPKKDKWNLPDLSWTFTPKIAYRGFHMCGDWYKVQDFHEWMARNLMNSHRHGHYGKTFKDAERGFYSIYSSHNVHLPKEMFASNPEYFALIDGKRYATQPCLTNPDALKLIAERLTKELEKNTQLDIVSLFLPDNMEYCKCPECAKKDVSTAYFDFYNKLTDILKARFPKIKFATLAYQGYIGVPKNPVRNSEFVEYATYPRCNIHCFGDPRCKRNAEVLKELEAWKATGVPIGNYGYEFDIFSRGVGFLPFFSMIDDAIKTGAKLGHVTTITEVILSPKSGPDEKVGTIRNRLPIYLYARLLAAPDADWKELLRDFCNYAYGKAAQPMYEYFVYLDSKWNALDGCRTILGSPVPTAEKLFTPEVQAKCAAYFVEADKALGGEKNPNVEREKILLAQWLSCLEAKDRVDLPLSTDSAHPGTDIPNLSAKAFWTKDTLYFKNIKTPFKLELTSGIGGETYYFEADAKGTLKTWQRTAVGTDNMLWKTEWTFANGTVAIPLAPIGTVPPDKKFSVAETFKFLRAPLGTVPSAGSKWQFALSEDGKKYPSGDTLAALVFSASAKTGRLCVWWPGTKERDEAKHPDVKKSFTDAGWKITMAETPANVLESKATAYWLRNPTGKNKLPDECWAYILKRMESEEIVLCIMAYMNTPLEKIFKDPSFAVKLTGIEKTNLSERKANYILEDGWFKKPNDLSSLKRIYTPAYCLHPEQPEVWTTLAALPKSAQETQTQVPFMLARRYGKGIVVLMAADFAINSPGLIENMIENMKAFPEPKTPAANPITGK